MKKLQTDYILILIAALFTFLASTFMQYGLILISLSPVFITLIRGKVSPFKAGAIFGAAFCLLLFYWMPAVIGNFSGGAMLPAWACYIVSALISALYFGLIGKITAFIIHKKSAKPLMQGLAAAAVWTLGDFLLYTLFKGMPWLYFFYGSILGKNIYFIQWAALGGEHLLSFAVVFINYLLGYYIVRRQWPRIGIPAAFACLLFLGGMGIFYWNNQNQQKPQDTILLTLMCENTPPEMKWDKDNGDELAQQLLQLHQKAASTHPQIILWTESAIPWTYRPDDDFVQAVTQQTKDSLTINIIGINSDFQGNSVFNSAYAINNSGIVLGRYDKRYLLDFAERPLFSLNLPFIGTDGFYAEPGSGDEPMTLPFGKVGTLICNESMVSSAATDLTRNGADFLVNISNDGWFSQAPLLINQHFYSARFRAVENRRDIVVNSNNGITGLIKADGTLINDSRDAVSAVKQFHIQPSQHDSFFTKFPWCTPAISFLIIMLTFLFGKRKQ